ncbi:MAG: LPS export ABC transporter ATP-binding protein [Betaproteobacteria bacterium AqS2]|uniref:Lipopolysaccharide export system ATP-binding protein LptB n=1 Tax=Candidatus Amphirhobacter heronislandensis TaxID=1732024 RepID=A0A930Y1L7_9GAMM|nr:LPS export ABC transporter ATP-binding protein [Betaproteobacteria bacterium AqS2]
MSTAAPLLEARGLAKRYRKRLVLEGVDIDVGPKETVGLLGPNGAGKSTSFGILAGLLRPTAGSVFYAGRDITALPVDERARLGVCLLPQERSVFATLSVIDNVKAVLELQNEPAATISDKAYSYLEDMGLGDLALQAATSLSGGELRRLEIARTLVLRPQVLLLDEPFAAIDPITVGELKEVMARLCADGISLVISDHNVRETLAACDRGYILLEGKVLCAGTPDELAADQRVRDSYLGKDFVI